MTTKANCLFNAIIDHNLDILVNAFDNVDTSAIVFIVGWDVESFVCEEKARLVGELVEALSGHVTGSEEELFDV